MTIINDYINHYLILYYMIYIHNLIKLHTDSIGVIYHYNKDDSKFYITNSINNIPAFFDIDLTDNKDLAIILRKALNGLLSSTESYKGTYTCIHDIGYII